MKILFVCLGNICRSPLAEGIFNKLLVQQNLAYKYTCDSAGTASYHIGKLPDSRTIKIAEKNGIILTHKARQFNKNDFYEFDLIIAMDRINLRDITQLKPYGNKTEINLMRNFDTKQTEKDVPDPYYGDMKDFELVYEILNTCCKNLLISLETKCIKTFHFKVYGKVQQVYFRQYTLNKANELGISGWVKNMPDLTVEGMATGNNESLALFEEWLWKGSPLSKVKQVEINYIINPETFDGFNII